MSHIRASAQGTYDLVMVHGSCLGTVSEIGRVSRLIVLMSVKDMNPISGCLLSALTSHRFFFREKAPRLTLLAEGNRQR